MTVDVNALPVDGLSERSVSDVVAIVSTYRFAKATVEVPRSSVESVSDIMFPPTVVKPAIVAAPSA